MDKHLENDMREINARRDSQLPDVLALTAARSDALRMLVSKPRHATRAGDFQFTCASRFIARFVAPRIAFRFAVASVVLCTVLYSAREWLGDTPNHQTRVDRVRVADTWNRDEAVRASEFQRRLASISMHSTAIDRSADLRVRLAAADVVKLDANLSALNNASAFDLGVGVTVALLDAGLEQTP